MGTAIPAAGGRALVNGEPALPRRRRAPHICDQAPSLPDPARGDRPCRRRIVRL